MAYIAVSMSAAAAPGSTGRPAKTKHAWVWEALSELSTDVITSNLLPQDFDWNQVHYWFGTPLMAMLPDLIRIAGHTNEEHPAWQLLKFCLAQGADPRTDVGTEVNVLGSTCGWGGEGTQFPKLEMITLKGHSAMSLVFAFLKELKRHDQKYDNQIKNAGHVLKLFASCAQPSDTTRVSVHESVVETWERLLLEQRFCDVELQVVDREGSSKGDSCTLKAHAAVLRTASRVLDATLASPMQEGRTGIIRVEGVSQESTQLCLHLIYTGTTTLERPKPAVLLGGLDLAHRWQVGHVVAMLEKELARLVGADTLLEFFEVAVLKDLPSLRSACKAFVAAQPHKKGGELQSKLAEIQSSLASAGHSAPSAKRPRRSL